MALRVWLPLNGTLENKGISDYVIQSANITIVDNGKIGKCYSFNGSSSYISITNFNLSNNWSYGCWINTPNSDSRGWEIAMVLNNSGSDADSQFAFWVHQKENRFESLANTQYTSTIPYTNYYNSWHHFFATFNGSLLTTYIDGNVVNTKTITAEYYPATNLTIGARSKNAAGTAFTNWFQGYLNDVRVYDHCLSPKEVKEISQGLILHYKLDGLSQGSGNNLVTGLTKGGQTTVVNDTIVTSGQNSDTYFKIVLSSALELNKSYTMGIDAENLPDGGYFRFPIGSQSNSSAGYIDIYNGHNEAVFIANDVIVNCGTLLMMDDNTRTAWPNQCIFKNFYIYENTSVADSSGYENDGTITGTLLSQKDSERYALSLNSPNGTDNIKSPLSLTDVQSFTCAFWVKPSSSNGGYSIIASNNNNPSTGFWIATNCEGHALWFYNSAYADTTTVSLSNNEWHHCAIVCNNKTFAMYIDGVAQTINRTTSSSKTITINNLSVFNSYTGTSWNTKRYGNISDFRFYISALSAEDILDLYHTSANVDNLGNLHGFEFIEGESKQSIYKNGQIATKYELQNNLWSGTQINASNMAVTYNYQTDVFRNYGFDTCMKFTPTHIADGTSWYGYSYICDNTIVYDLAETYTFSMYAYVSTDCNANFRVHTEHANQWVSNYQGTTANINDTTKGQVIKVWGKAKTNASDGKIYLMFYFNPNLVDTFTTGYILVAGLNVVIGDTIYPPGIMPMNGFNQDKNISSIKNDLIIMNDFIEK